MDIKLEIKIINKFVVEGNYHAAMNVAIAAVNTCRRKNEQASIDTFLNIIKGISDTMIEEFGSKQVYDTVLMSKS